MSMRVLGVIPARGGSKGLPGKNILPLDGLPLICHTIQAASRSRLARTIVSTDDPEIAAVARACGGDVPFLRPPELAQDETPTLPAILHALEQVGSSDYDAVMILQPTSPLRSAGDIDAALTMLEVDPAADSVISVVKVGDNHPARMKELRDGVLVDPPFAEETEGKRRQDLPDYYLRNGAIYLTRTPVLLRDRSLKGRRCLGYLMPEERSVNIDGRLDLLLARAILAERNVMEGRGT